MDALPNTSSSHHPSSASSCTSSSCTSSAGNDPSRKSAFVMISVDDGLKVALEQCAGLQKEVVVPLHEACGKVAAEDVFASDPFPPFPASIMDGYAVRAPLQKGVYDVVSQRVHAGGDSGAIVDERTVAYITTGAMIPEGANAVVKIEDTEGVSLNTKSHADIASSSSTSQVREKGSSIRGEKQVNIKVDVNVGTNIRSIGSDIASGEKIILSGHLINAVDVGLMATVGVSAIKVFAKPIVGVMSTGNELVDYDTVPIGSQIRDSNRISLISAFRENGVEVKDLGILRDDEDEVTREAIFLDACRTCDIVVTSGGVSMGEMDWVKPMLVKLGKVHFGRLNMKPGKPTTFATVDVPVDFGSFATLKKKTLFFALPGNPVSCLVTKMLMIDPTIKRLQGFSSLDCMHSQVIATYKGTGPIKLDPERPEYHRGIVSFDSNSSEVTVESTSNHGVGQRSSRLLSIKNANALICVPQGTGGIQPGSKVVALLVEPHFFRPPSSAEQCFHQIAASIDSKPIHNIQIDDASSRTSSSSEQVDRSQTIAKDTSATTVFNVINGAIGVNTGPGYESFANLLTTQKTNPASSPSTSSTPAIDNKDDSSSGGGIEEAWRIIRVALLTVSDRASQGIYPDDSGPAMRDMLQKMSTAFPDGAADKYPLQFTFADSCIVPDEIDLIREKVEAWSASGVVDMILTSGGTGFGPRDRTPEAIRPLLHREAPGIAQALLNEGLKHTPLAVLSRPVSGTRNDCFICTLPGSVKAVKENIVALKPLLPRIMELIKSGKCSV